MIVEIHCITGICIWYVDLHINMYEDLQSLPRMWCSQGCIEITGILSTAFVFEKDLEHKLEIEEFSDTEGILLS